MQHDENARLVRIDAIEPEVPEYKPDLDPVNAFLSAVYHGLETPVVFGLALLAMVSRYEIPGVASWVLEKRNEVYDEQINLLLQNLQIGLKNNLSRLSSLAEIQQYLPSIYMGSDAETLPNANHWDAYYITMNLLDKARSLHINTSVLQHKVLSTNSTEQFEYLSSISPESAAYASNVANVSAMSEFLQVLLNQVFASLPAIGLFAGCLFAYYLVDRLVAFFTLPKNAKASSDKAIDEYRRARPDDGVVVLLENFIVQPDQGYENDPWFIFWDQGSLAWLAHRSRLQTIWEFFKKNSAYLSPMLKVWMVASILTLLKEATDISAAHKSAFEDYEKYLKDSYNCSSPLSYTPEIICDATVEGYAGSFWLYSVMQDSAKLMISNIDYPELIALGMAVLTAVERYSPFWPYQGFVRSQYYFPPMAAALESAAASTFPTIILAVGLFSTILLLNESLNLKWFKNEVDELCQAYLEQWFPELYAIRYANQNLLEAAWGTGLDSLLGVTIKAVNDLFWFCIAQMGYHLLAQGVSYRHRWHLANARLDSYARDAIMRHTQEGISLVRALNQAKNRLIQGGMAELNNNDQRVALLAAPQITESDDDLEVGASDHADPIPHVSGSIAFGQFLDTATEEDKQTLVYWLVIGMWKYLAQNLQFALMPFLTTAIGMMVSEVLFPAYFTSNARENYYDYRDSLPGCGVNDTTTPATCNANNAQIVVGSVLANSTTVAQVIDYFNSTTNITATIVEYSEQNAALGYVWPAIGGALFVLALGYHLYNCYRGNYRQNEAGVMSRGDDDYSDRDAGDDDNFGGEFPPARGDDEDDSATVAAGVPVPTPSPAAAVASTSRADSTVVENDDALEGTAVGSAPRVDSSSIPESRTASVVGSSSATVAAEVPVVPVPTPSPAAAVVPGSEPARAVGSAHLVDLVPTPASRTASVVGSSSATVAASTSTPMVEPTPTTNKKSTGDSNYSGVLSSEGRNSSGHDSADMGSEARFTPASAALESVRSTPLTGNSSAIFSSAGRSTGVPGGDPSPRS